LRYLLPLSLFCLLPFPAYAHGDAGGLVVIGLAYLLGTLAVLLFVGKWVCELCGIKFKNPSPNWKRLRMAGGVFLVVALLLYGRVGVDRIVDEIMPNAEMVEAAKLDALPAAEKQQQLARLKAAAEKGDTGAMRDLAEYYRHKDNYEEAFFYFFAIGIGNMHTTDLDLLHDIKKRLSYEQVYAIQTRVQQWKKEKGIEARPGQKN